MARSRKTAQWLVTWRMFGEKTPRRRLFSGERKARAFYKKLCIEAPESQSIEKEGSGVDKLKPLPIWSLEIGERVRVKKTIRPYGGKPGKVVDRTPGVYWVLLDLMKNINVPHERGYRRDELVKV